MEYVFPYYGVRVISINDHFDSWIAVDSSGGLEVALKNLMNECYSRDISRKISSAVHVKKMSGEYCYGAVPFGYKKGGKKNTIVPDQETADIVRYIFSLACEGNTISQIAKRLNMEQVITPSKYLARPNYKVVERWGYESVRNILSNRIYIGDTEGYKSHVVKVGSNQVKLIPEDERLVIKNTHEALVSRGDYQKAKEVVKSNVKSKKNCEISREIVGVNKDEVFLINWGIVKSLDGIFAPTNAFIFLTNNTFPFAKIQYALFKGTERVVFIDEIKGELLGVMLQEGVRLEIEKRGGQNFLEL